MRSDRPEPRRQPGAAGEDDAAGAGGRSPTWEAPLPDPPTAAARWRSLLTGQAQPPPDEFPPGADPVPLLFCPDPHEAKVLAGELATQGIPYRLVERDDDDDGDPPGDAEHAAEVLRRAGGDDLEPAEDDGPAGASAGGGEVDEDGRSARLVQAAAFESARLLRDAATTLASARVRAYLPRLVPRGDRPAGGGKRFILRVREEDLGRAREVLADAEEEADDEAEPCCPKCKSWRVWRLTHFWQGIASVFRLAPKPEAGYECLRCHHRGPDAEFAGAGRGGG